MTEDTMGRMGGVQIWGWDSAGQQWVKILVNAAGKLIIDPSEILEDPPTDGETAKAPNSNWAFDHNARNATAAVQGHATAAQITKLDGIETGADVTGNHAPQAHKVSHQDGGSDEISIEGLAGAPAQKGAASGLASLNASTKVVEQPASITDHLEDSPTDGVTTKAPTSNWAYDQRFPIKFPVSLHFESLDLYTKYTGGSGTYAATTLFSLAIQTGLTNASYCRISHAATIVLLMTAGQIIVFNIQFPTITNQLIRLYLADSENPNEVSDHMGFKLVDNILSATNGDGTTEKATAFRTLAGACSMQLMAHFVNATTIKYYESYQYGAWTLVATHTVNLPNAGYERFVWHIANTQAEGKTCLIFSTMAARV